VRQGRFADLPWPDQGDSGLAVQCILNRCEGPSRNHACKLNAVSSICKVSGHKRGTSRSGAAEKKPLRLEAKPGVQSFARFGLLGAAGWL